MDIVSIFNKFKTQKQAIKFLEKTRWGKEIKCTYCGSDRITKRKGDRYHHCGACNKSFSVTVGTIFHDTKLPIQKWFLAISIISNAKKRVSSLQLARDLDVNQKTARRMQMQIREAMNNEKQRQLFTGIIECDECYIGGKKNKGDKKKSDDDNDINKRGRGTDKQGVIGIVERESGKLLQKIKINLHFQN